MAIDSRALRQTVGQFATGVAVIALEVDATIRALTANSFTSLSLDPPLVLFCVGKHTRAGQAVHAARAFSINILSETQQELATYFAGSWKGDTPPTFAFDDWEGMRRLDGCLASIACVVEAIHEGGDHWIVVGRVTALHRCETDLRPLVFFRGSYTPLAEERAVAAPAAWFEGIGW